MRLLLILRAEIFIGVGLFITFNQAHTYATGVLALALFAFGYAVVSFLALMAKRQQVPILPTSLLIAVALAIGVATEVLAPNAGFWLAKLIAAWGITAGAIELAQAFRAGLKTARGRDLLISGGLSALFGVFFVAVPLAELDTVGFFGAYLILSAVHLGIAAASERKTIAG